MRQKTVPSERVETYKRRPSKQAALATIRCMQEGGAAYLNLLNRILRENLEYVVGVLNELGFVTHVPDGTHVLFVRLRQESDVNKFEAAKIGVSMGDEYACPGYVRVNVGYPSQLLRLRYGALASLMKG